MKSIYRSQHIAVLSLIVGLAGLTGCSLSGNDTTIKPQALSFDTSSPRIEGYAQSNALVDMDMNMVTAKINAVRRSHFLRGFHVDDRLMRAAANHAQYMGERGIYGHQFGPDTQFQKRIFRVGFNNSAGENLGVGYQDLDAAIEGWLNSPAHRRNMLKPNYDGFGLAYARNVSGKNPRFDHYWVLIMGKT